MPISTKEQVSAALNQAYDPEHYERIYRQMRYAFGEPWKGDLGIGGQTGGRLLTFPDITVKFLKVGQSRRILNSQFIQLSRVMYSQPAPEFPQVDKITAEIRKQAILTRGEGDDDKDGEWGDENAMAFLDWDAVGYGGCQIYLTTNPQTKLQKACIRHIPAGNIIWDRHERNPGRANLMAFVHYLSPDECDTKYGHKVTKANVRMQQDGTMADRFEVVRVIEFYDMGMGKADPTRMVLANDLDGELLEDGDNEFECIPFAHGLHFVAPGMRRPIGRVALQMSTQETINQIEANMLSIMRKRGGRFIVTDKIEAVDMNRLRTGNYDLPFRLTGSDGKPPFFDMPAENLPNGVLELLQLQERQWNTDSGQSELDRGNQLSGADHTLGEAQLLDQRSKVQGIWSQLQAVKYYERLYRKFLKIAGKFDRDPIELDINGQNYTLNQQGNPNSFFDKWTAERSKIVISEDSLEFADQRAERASKIAQLQALAANPIVAQQLNPQEYAEEFCKALGYDPKELLMEAQPAAPGAMPGVPGQPPMPGQPGLPPYTTGPEQAGAPVSVPNTYGIPGQPGAT